MKKLGKFLHISRTFLDISGNNAGKIPGNFRKFWEMSGTFLRIFRDISKNCQEIPRKISEMYWLARCILWPAVMQILLTPVLALLTGLFAISGFLGGASGRFFGGF